MAVDTIKATGVTEHLPKNNGGIEPKIISADVAFGKELGGMTDPGKGIDKLVNLPNVDPALTINDSTGPSQIETTPPAPPSVEPPAAEATLPSSETPTATPTEAPAAVVEPAASVTAPTASEAPPTAAPPAETNPPAEAPNAEADEMKKIGDRLAAGDIISDADYAKYQQFKEMQDLESKYKNGTATASERARYLKSKEPAAKDKGQEAADQIAGEKKPTAQEKTDKIMADVAEGRLNQVEGLWEIAKIAQQGKNSGEFSAEDWKKAATQLAERSSADPEHRSFIADFIYNKFDELQQDMLELAQLEAQLAEGPKQIDALRQRREQAKEAVNRVKDAKAEKPEDQQKLAQEKYKTRMELLAASKAVIVTLEQMTVNGARLKQLEVTVDTKLGVNTGWSAIFKPVVAQCQVMLAEAQFDMKAMGEMPELFLTP